MAKEKIWLWFGIDVSKDTFSAAFHEGFGDTGANPPGGRAFANGRRGAGGFLRWLRSVLGALPEERRGMPFGVAMEWTGSYTTGLVRELTAADPSLRISICDPGSVSHYIRSRCREKTDATDARGIARYAFDSQPPEWRPMDPSRRLLREMVRQRSKLTEIMVMLRNRDETIEFKEVEAENRRLLRIIERKVAQAERRIVELVRSVPGMREEAELMQTVPGIGPLVSATICAELGSLRDYTVKQLSAMSGVCPAIRQSGTSLNRSRLSKRGSRLLRKMLFLAASQSMGRIPAVAALAERLRARADITRMTVHCACMRKTLMIARGVVVSGLPFDPNHVSVRPEKKSDESA